VATGNMTHLAALTAPQIGWIVLTSALLFLYVTSWYAGLKLIPASRAACVLLLGSAITTILSFIYAGSVTIAGLAGAAFILSGVIVIIGYSHLVSKIRILLPSKN
jgi:drug/metabolite transporter (DMT)-like permease